MASIDPYPQRLAWQPFGDSATPSPTLANLEVDKLDDDAISSAAHGCDPSFRLKGNESFYITLGLGT